MNLLFTVSDTGIGIAEEKLSTLFDSFAQADSSTSRQYGGSGLGLSISRQLVEMMGGRIGASSKPGQGSRFWFNLCFKKQTESAPAKTTMQNDISGKKIYTEKPQKSLNILVAEDHVPNQKLILAMLKKLGHRAQLAANGIQVLELLKQNTFDLVLMDCQMPEKDGYQTSLEIRSEQSAYSDIPIIALTAEAMQGARESCLKAGMDDYLSKPLLPEDLAQMLTRWSQVKSTASPGPEQEKTKNEDTEGPLQYIDWNYASQLMNHDQELVQIVIDNFTQSAHSNLTELQIAIADGNETKVKIVAHSMKSDMRSLGAHEPAETAKKLEQAGKSGNLVGVWEIFDQLKDQVRILLAEIKYSNN